MKWTGERGKDLKGGMDEEADGGRQSTKVLTTYSLLDIGVGGRGRRGGGKDWLTTTWD